MQNIESHQERHSQFSKPNISSTSMNTSHHRQVLAQIDTNREHHANVSQEARSSKAWKHTTHSSNGATTESTTLPSSPLQANTSNTTESTASHDEPHMDNPQHCIEYIREITQHLYTIEDKSMPDPNYMHNQAEISANMRSILNDWILDVHFKFRLNQETLYLTVNLIDRFLSKLPCSRTQLQLLGVTALMIACKYEEIYHPKTSKLLEICAGVYSKEHLLNMEICLLNALQYQITAATPYFFLKRFLHICCANDTQRMTAFYLSELALLSYPMIKYKSSHLAAACVCLAMRLDAPELSWDQNWAEHVRFTSQDLSECVQELANLGAAQQNFLSQKLNACSKKYSRQRRMSVSQFVPEALASLRL